MSIISHDDVGQDLRHIMISGRLDTTGTRSIAAQLMELADGSKKAVVVDLCDVKFLASVGIGALISSAQAMKARGGKMAVVADAGSSVMMSLEATGLDELIPVFTKLSDAEKAVQT